MPTRKLVPASLVMLAEFYRRKPLSAEECPCSSTTWRSCCCKWCWTWTPWCMISCSCISLWQDYSQQGEVKDLAATMERAQLLISLVDQGQMGAVWEGPSNIEWLQEQIEKLMEQVTALSTSLLCMADTGWGQKCWFYCNRVGHVQRMCPWRHQGTDGRRWVLLNYSIAGHTSWCSGWVCSS